MSAVRANPAVTPQTPPAVPRGRLSFAVAALIAFGILIALGVWQLERRAWKNSLIARFEAALSQPPVTYDPSQPAGAGAREFMHVVARGEFLNVPPAKMLIPTPEAARAHTREGFGYLIFAPFRTGKTVIFVNRGFVPQNLAGDPSLSGKGPPEVAGIIRLSERPNWFIPAPDPARKLFFAADIGAMASAAGLTGSEIETAEYIQAEPSKAEVQWPLPRDPHELVASIPNRHLEYALTWFGLALTLAAMSGVYILRI